VYLRSQPEHLGESVRRISIIGEADYEPDVEERWLVFSREATTDDGAAAGHVEIAFSIRQEEETDRWSVQPMIHSPLIVSFPTVLETHLGFLAQGPYRTTPARDNVPPSDPWNQHLLGETASLLVEALRWLRDEGALDIAVLRCLALSPTKFGEANMFAPLYEATKEALSSEPLLPRYGPGYVPATSALLGRTQELRDLFSATQLSALYGQEDEHA